MARRRADTPLDRRQKLRRIKGDREMDGFADALTDPLLREAVQDMFDADDASHEAAYNRMQITVFEDMAALAQVFFRVTAEMFSPDATIRYVWNGKQRSVKRIVMEFALMVFSVGWQAGRRSVIAEQARHRLRPD